MKAIAAMEPGRVDVVDIEPPPYEDHECLVRVRASGLCNSTDLKIIDDHISEEGVEYPCVLGHESVGEVVEVGSRVQNIELGDRFTNPLGRLAPASAFGRMWGAMKEYAIVQDRRVMDDYEAGEPLYGGAFTLPIPREMDFHDAAVLLTLKECYSALINFGFEPGMQVLVYGDGPVGMGLAKFMRMQGAGWLGVVGHHDERLAAIRRVAGPEAAFNSHEVDMAEAVGERTFDLVIDAVGSTSIILTGSQMLRQGGKVGVYGVLAPGHGSVDLRELKNNTTVHMLNWPHGEHDVHEELVQMAMDGRLDLSDFYSHVVPIEDAAEGVRLIREREAFKVIYDI